MPKIPEAPPVLVAVASKDGLQINVHFGHATSFRLYRVGPNGIAAAEERQAETYCQDNEGADDRMAVILRALADCAAVFVARIGPTPKRALAAAGIEPVDAYGYEAVEPSLRAWFQNRSALPPEDTKTP